MPSPELFHPGCNKEFRNKNNSFSNEATRRLTPRPRTERRGMQMDAKEMDADPFSLVPMTTHVFLGV